MAKMTAGEAMGQVQAALEHLGIDDQREHVGNAIDALMEIRQAGIVEPASPPAGIVLRNAYGEWKATAEQLDRAIAKLLPASVNMLRERFEEHAGPTTYERVGTVAEFLIMFCDTGYLDR